VQAIGQERHEDVRFHALFSLMKDRPDGQIALEVLKRLFHRHQLQVEAPELGRIGLGQVGAQQIAAFAPPHATELLPAQAITE
jgi:hypothetical protein